MTCKFVSLPPTNWTLFMALGSFVPSFVAWIWIVITELVLCFDRFSWLKIKEQKLFWRRNLGRKLFVISLAVVNKSGKFSENSQPGRIYLSPSALNCKWKPNSSITNWISRDRSFVILETCIACLSQHLCGAVTLLVQCKSSSLVKATPICTFRCWTTDSTNCVRFSFD